MDKETYIRAVLESIFTGFRDELIEIAVHSIVKYADEAKPIISCKDCKYFKALGGANLCKAWDDIFYVDVDENGYCYKAERKDVK